MPREKGYKAKGDRVIVINKVGFGLHGLVRWNDGYGEVFVDLDDGRTFSGYEGRDLIYEDEQLPEKPVDSGGIKKRTDYWQEIGPDGTRSKFDDLLGGEISD